LAKFTFTAAANSRWRGYNIFGGGAPIEFFASGGKTSAVQATTQNTWNTVENSQSQVK